MRTPLANERRNGHSARQPARERARALGAALQPALDVARAARATAAATPSSSAAKIAGRSVIANGAAAGEQPDAQAEAVDQQRAGVDDVQQHHEGDHAAGDQPRLHARATQRPGGQRDAAGAGGGEQPRGGQRRPS